jgi:transposase
MGRTRPPYPSEFRAEAVRAVHESGRPLTQLARDLGVSPQTLASWVAQAGLGGPEAPLSAAERDDLARLRQEVVLLREERDVLRRAAALFARESVRDPR